MKRKSPTEPPIDSQKTLEAWRLLFESETYKNDLDSLPGNGDPVFGFEVEWEDLISYDALHVKFSENMTETLLCGNQVLKEQYSNRNMATRPVIRVVNLPDDRAYEISQLRMRDRTRLLSFDAIVVSTSPIIGWLKTSVHKCNDCDSKWTIQERLARPREKIKYCRTCLDVIISNMESKKPKSYHKDPTDVSMVAEENYYEDVQYLEVVSPDMLENGMAANGESFQVVVFDEYVGNFSKGDNLTINAVVAVDPLINRDFIRDTRRMIYLQAHSVEDGFSHNKPIQLDLSKQESLS
jgi:DNA replicative helicase MCM subunit Mcm2 (Cdc46/Mcm family)